MCHWTDNVLWVSAVEKMQSNFYLSLGELQLRAERKTQPQLRLA